MFDRARIMVIASAYDDFLAFWFWNHRLILSQATFVYVFGRVVETDFGWKIVDGVLVDVAWEMVSVIQQKKMSFARVGDAQLAVLHFPLPHFGHVSLSSLSVSASWVVIET